ncbi:MAG: PQQ-dependent dehydrogenase, methanol/ethanol family [Pseudomonadota bacterium]
MTKWLERASALVGGTAGVLVLAGGLAALPAGPATAAGAAGAAGGSIGAAGALDPRFPTSEADGRNWVAFGRTHEGTHSSPLDQIDRGNVARLGLAWSLDLADVQNGATVPLAVDGVIYLTAGQSLVHAVDARSGRLLWRYDPEVWKVAGRKLRKTWGPRGLAYWDGKLYVGTTDGRLVALDAKTGEPVWSTLTVAPTDAMTITGAPRVFGGLVIIGNGGSEWGPSRGYVTAYDAKTGAQRWRWHVIPGNPADGFENAAMEMAAKTWTGDWWARGGGGQVWNAITYDPELDRVYIGTGNGAPWNQRLRSPDGGDNLFLCSIVALDAKTGEYVWHYQTVPGETWDYNSAMDIALARVEIDGRERRVLLHAPKNGFFYVIDRDTGKLLSAEKFGKVTWASHVDLATGRPVEVPGARYESGPTLVWPSTIGAHNWHPMSWNRWTGLVYIPTLEMPGLFGDASFDRATWRPVPNQLNTGIDGGTSDAPENAGTSALVAWDPLAQRERWRAPTPGFWNGGTMTTAGRLVFQGQADGAFNAYDAETGTKLWSFDAKMGISGAPITYSVNGRQHVSVVAGWGAAGPAYLGSLTAQHGWVARRHPHRLLTFVLDGKAQLPPTPPPGREVPIDDPAFVVDAAKAEAGAQLYAGRCVGCHGLAAVAAGYAPDLRASAVALSAEAFDSVVRQGSMMSRNMPRFEELTPADLETLRHYLRARARESLAAAKAPAAAPAGAVGR